MMPNINVEVTMPDSFYRLIEDGYEAIGWEDPTRPEMVAAFQEMINLLGIALSVKYSPDLQDVTYFKEMDSNIATFGDGRMRTPEAESIGGYFLLLLSHLAQMPLMKDLIDQASRRGDDPPQRRPRRRHARSRRV